MKLIYIVGPYRSDTEQGLVENIRKAEALALRVWKTGNACICPHKNTAFFGGAADDSLWLEGDLEIIRRCDAVVCAEGWENSEGSRAEVSLAREISIPAFSSFDAFWEWLGI